jgi:hypothetical protein
MSDNPVDIVDDSAMKRAETNALKKALKEKDRASAAALNIKVPRLQNRKPLTEEQKLKHKMSQRKFEEKKRLEKIQKMKDELEDGSLIALRAPEKLNTRCLHPYDSLSADRKRILRNQIEHVIRDSMGKMFPNNNSLSTEKEKEFIARLAHFNFGIQPEDIKAAQGKKRSR